MKKFLLSLLILLFSFNPFVAAAKITTMPRTSDNLAQSEIDSIQQKTDTALEQQQQGTLETNISTLPQVFTIYGWYSPTEESIQTSSNTIISGGETRATLSSPSTSDSLEAIKIYSKSTDLAFKYSVKLEGEDWQGEQTGTYDLAQCAGNTTEESKKIVNLKINLSGLASLFYDVYYRVNLEGSGWSGWTNNGNSVAAEESLTHFNNLDVRILPKGSASPPSVVQTQDIPLILASAHISNQGSTKTTVGKSIALGQENSDQGIEGLVLKTSNAHIDLSYQSYINNQGWQDRKSGGEFSGTKDQGLFLEAIKIRLEGEQASGYDVYYRTYIQGYGWLDWANNDQISGTLNQNLKIEAINIRILPKGSLLPGNTDLPSVIALNQQEGEFIKKLNTQRHEKGLLPVTSTKDLGDVTAVRLNELTLNYSHLRPNNRGYETILSEMNYRADSIKPALGECFTKSADINQVFSNFESKEICQNLLYTDYYRYCSLATANGDEETEPITVVLLTNEASNYDYLY